MLRPGIGSRGDRRTLAAELGTIFGRQADLGVLSAANLVYAAEVVAHGRPIFARDRTTAARFAMHTLSMCAALQEPRREVLRFRNVAIHQYEQMDMNVLRWVVESGHRRIVRPMSPQPCR